MAGDIRTRSATVLVVAVAIASLLAMHGFESTLVHEGHAGPGGHVRTSAPSAAEIHVQSGSCSLDEPGTVPAPAPDVCGRVQMVDERSGEVGGVDAFMPRLANRGVLTAFSVLRL